MSLAPVLCTALFEELSRDDPPALVALALDPQTRPAHLTFIAEYLHHIPWETALPAFLHLLQSTEPVVLEGALLGLGENVHRNEVRAHVERLREHPSQAVRGLAHELLSEPP